MNKHFVVCKASAGSGKTFKLVSDYITLCLNSSSSFTFSRILAITFTNKAASEMKERIIDHLRSLSADINHSHYNQAWINHYAEKTQLSHEAIRDKSAKILESILHNYTSFSVCTIDKFTHKLIRSFARDLQIAADFEIKLDPDENLNKTTDELISLAGYHEETTELLEYYIQHLTDEGENWLPEKEIRNFSKQLLDEESSFHLNKIQNLSHGDFKKMLQFIQTKIDKHTASLDSILNKFTLFLHENQLTLEDIAFGKIGPARLFIRIKNKNIDDPKFNISDRDLKLLNANNFLKKEIATKTPSMVLDNVTQHFSALFQLLGKPHREYVFYKLLQKNIFNLSLIKQLSEKLNEINRTENTLLIAEFNKIISDVIKNDPAPFIYERIGERYHHILVDEFQDTSVMQFQNMLPLIANSLAGNHTCMLVGDPKQAIYRWRGGDIDQFIGLPDTKSIYDELIKENFVSETLEFNYRSGEKIVQFNNSFFKSASSILSKEYREIYQDLEQKNVHPGGYVQFTAVPSDEINSEEYILNQTIEKINECLDSGFSYTDIAILTRNKKEGFLLAQRLTELNIPVISDESLLLESSEEVNLIMNFIRHLAFPKDPVAAFKVLEYFYRVNKKTVPDEWYDKKNNPDINPAILLEKEGITFNRSKIIGTTSYQIIQQVIEIFLPDCKSIYLRFLNEFVYNQWKNSPLDVLALYRWWEENKHELSIQSGTNNNSIQILTIHASKGLQFPVVIFPFASWRQKNGRDWLWINLTDETIPVKTVIVKSNASRLDQSDYSSLKANEKSKTILDDFNLLYVAFTRPEKRLYIISDEDNSMKIFSEYLKNSLEQKSENTWSVGETESVKNKNIFSTELFSVLSHQHNNSEDRMRLSLTSTKGKDEQEEQYKSKKTGIFLHSVFENCHTETEAEKWLETASLTDPFIFTEKEQLRKEIKTVYNHPVIRTFFQHKNILNECSLVDLDGTTLRPDKVIIDQEEVIICDFKTGKFRKKHIEQMNDYGKMFEKLNYKSIKKYLFYTSTGKLEIV